MNELPIDAQDFTVKPARYGTYRHLDGESRLSAFLHNPAIVFVWLAERGFAGDFSTATLNGREQASTGDNRGVEFDQYPSELLSQVVVYKTPDAALVGVRRPDLNDVFLSLTGRALRDGGAA